MIFSDAIDVHVKDTHNTYKCIYIHTHTHTIYKTSFSQSIDHLSFSSFRWVISGLFTFKIKPKREKSFTDGEQKSL